MGAANSGDRMEHASSVTRMITEGIIRKLRICGAITPTVLNAGDYTETAADQQSAWDQAYRQCRRALPLIIRAKRDVEFGITTPESEFLAKIALPDAGTVGQWPTPEVDESYAMGRMSPMQGVEIS